MNLIKLPLRIATVKALDGATYAGDKVFDSVIAPIDAKSQENRGVPLIVVYTDDAHGLSSTMNGSHDLTGIAPRVHLVLHLIMAKELSTSAGGQRVVIAASDSGLEASLDIMGAQVLRALQHGQSPWADLWRTLVRKIDDIHVRRGASARKGLRFAAREIVLPIETFADPLGTGLEWPWNDVVTVFGADEETSDLALILGDFCTDLTSRPDWAQDLAILGMGQKEALALSFVDQDGDIIEFQS